MRLVTNIFLQEELRFLYVIRNSETKYFLETQSAGQKTTVLPVPLSPW
jgi:hypothetical protein